MLHPQDGLVILGDPGSGKTTFLKYLALQLTAGKYAAAGLGERLPILVPLSGFANELGKRVGRSAWHEINRLAIGYVGLVQQLDGLAGKIVEALLPIDSQARPVKRSCWRARWWRMSGRRE